MSTSTKRLSRATEPPQSGKIVGHWLVLVYQSQTEAHHKYRGLILDDYRYRMSPCSHLNNFPYHVLIASLPLSSHS